jgi:3-methyladenine DNA glycosylase/8-oxoguanine DNA glycosylase
VKVLATTNCTWGLTKTMVRNLVARFDRGGAFPGAPFLASLSAREIEGLKFGYRAPYLAAFAERVASGALDLARWEDAGRPDAEVEGEIRAQKGFGPYAADTLGRLLGRHGRLGLDSWSRKKVSVLRFRGRKVSDGRVARFYAPFGRHAGLAFWLDVTRDWHFETERLWP